MPLVINGLGGGHTHIHTRTCIHPHRSDFKKPAPGLKSLIHCIGACGNVLVLYLRDSIIAFG